jgi:type I restriction enzyme R subunit
MHCATITCAVSEAFSAFISDGTATTEQIEFINMVVEHLTARGVMDPGLLYTSPFTDIAPQGPEQVFDDNRVTQLVCKIQQLNDAAVA